MKIHDLTTTFSPFLHILGADESTACDLMWSLHLFPQRSNIVCRVLRGKKMKSVSGLYDEFGAALQFPYYFGENSAAFDECLADLEWLPANAYILAVFDAPSFLSEESEREFSNVMLTLQEVRATWNEGRRLTSTEVAPPTPFHVIFQCSPEAIQSVMQRIQNSLHDTEVDILDLS